MLQTSVRTFLATLEDRPGVLNRVASLFRRRAFNIESLTVGRTERPGVSRMTLVVRTDEDAARRLEANLYKLVNVLAVEDVTHAPTVVRELALIKVRANGDVRAAVMQLCEVFRARVVDVTPKRSCSRSPARRTSSTASSRCSAPTASSSSCAPAPSR